MTHIELASLIGTWDVKNSKVNDWMGRNVRCPSLVPGTLYIMKEWTIKHHVNYNNPFQVVEFIGSGRDDTGERVLFAENPAIKDMKDGDYFYFKGGDTEGKDYVFGAYMHENWVCITSSAVRVTCYAILGHESEGLPQGAAKPIRQSVVRKLAAIDSDEPIADDYDDGLGCPGARVCHPISMVPYKHQPQRG